MLDLFKQRPKASIAITAGVIVLLIAGSFWAWREFRTETFTVNGLVQATEYHASSQLGGRVNDILVAEGDTVEGDDVLLTLDASEVNARLAQAQAAVSQAEAQKGVINNGARAGEIQAAGEQVRQAEQALRLARESGTATVAKLEAQLTAAKTQLSAAQKAAANAPKMLEEGLISQQRYEQLQDSLVTAQSQVIAAEKALNNAGKSSRAEQIAMAQSRLNAARAQYNELRRGASSDERNAASAGVSQAQSAVKALESKLSETTVKANINGTVSILAVGLGELVLPGQTVATLINPNDLWADVYVPENRLYLVRPGDKVAVHASAFPKNVTFNGEVANISPKSEFVPGVEASTEEAVFRVKLRLKNEDISGRAVLYPGMRINAVFERPALL